MPARLATLNDGTTRRELFDGGPGQNHGRGEVGRDDVAKSTRGVLQNGTAVVQPGVVDQDVEAAEVGDDAVGKLEDGFEIRHVPPGKRASDRNQAGPRDFPASLGDERPARPEPRHSPISRATANPIPDDAPVTRATLPASEARSPSRAYSHCRLPFPCPSR